MKTRDEIIVELKRDNRSHRLADMLTEMPAAAYWRNILDEVSEHLRTKGDGELNLQSEVILMRQKASSGVM